MVRLSALLRIVGIKLHAGTLRILAHFLCSLFPNKYYRQFTNIVGRIKTVFTNCQYNVILVLKNELQIELSVPGSNVFFRFIRH